MFAYDYHTNSDVTIKTMSEENVRMAFEWAKDEGWNPSALDYKACYNQDPSGFLMLFKGNEAIGSIAAVKYSCHTGRHEKQFGFLGLFIVKAQFRGQGYGKKLFDAALQKLGKIPLGLNAVPQQVSRYQLNGFFSNETLNSRYNTHIHNNHWQYEPPSGSQDANDAQFLENCQKQQITQFLDSEVAMFACASRKPFLKELLNNPSVHCVFTYNHSQKIDGFAIARPCLEGYRVSITAQTFEDAKKLAENVFQDLPSTSVFFDIPSENPFAYRFIEFFNLQLQQESNTVPMYKDDFPETTRRITYGLLGLEIGN